MHILYKQLSIEGRRLYHWRGGRKLTASGHSGFRGSMRLTVASLMNAFWVKKDMLIESGMLTLSLEGAHKKEETYYDNRKQMFKYDEVMNKQRKAVITERRRMLEGRELKAQVISYGEHIVKDIVNAYMDPELPTEEKDLSRLFEKVA